MHGPNNIGQINDDENFEEQRDRDRLMRMKRVRTSNSYQVKFKQLWKIQLAKHLINDLKNFGPVGLIHVEAVSSLIGRPIKIWKSGDELYRTINGDQINENKIQRSVDVEYHQNYPKCIGHWTLRGNRDPSGVEKDLNACLFAVIASQTERRAADLRTSTVNYLNNNMTRFTDRIDEFLSSNGKNATPLMIGGARYVGTSPQAAKIILDNSQNARCHLCPDVGHSRGHASDIDATGPKDSVENYSRTTNGMKSGFLSKTDQDEVAHYALTHARARDAMRNLNTGSSNQALTLSAQELQSKGCVLPKMKEWFMGEQYSGELNIIRVTLVLRHHHGKQNDPDADVFVHTFYPRSN